MSRIITLASVARSLVVAAFVAAAIAVSGCNADAIAGPESNEGPTVNAASQGHGSQPGNDDCSVGGC